MISSVYTQLTVDEKEIKRLTPSGEPASLGILIDGDYKSDRLPPLALSHGAGGR